MYQTQNTGVLYCVKNLGIFIDSSLTWNNQISHTIRKCFNSLYLLNQLRKFIPDDTKKYLVQLLVFPHLYYCDTVFTDLSALQIRQLQLVHNSCCRFVCGLKKYDHVSKSLNMLKCPKLHLVRDFHVLCLLYLCITDPDMPEYLKNRFHTLAATHGRNTVLVPEIISHCPSLCS
jgi:hypothetical protein